MGETRGTGFALAEAAGRLSGLAVLQAMIGGELPPPPISATLSFWLAEAREGFAAFEGDTGEHLLNPLGIVHGGWALTLIDSCAYCAGLSLLAAGVGCTSVETKVNFSRPILPTTERVRAEGRAITSGRRVLTAEGTLRALADGKVLAHGTSTLLVLEGTR